MLAPLTLLVYLHEEGSVGMFGGFLQVFPQKEFCAYCSAKWRVNVL